MFFDIWMTRLSLLFNMLWLKLLLRSLGLNFCLNDWRRSWNHDLRSSMCHRRWSRLGSFRRCNRRRSFFLGLYFGGDLCWRGFDFNDRVCLRCMDIGFSLLGLGVWFGSNRRRDRSNMNRHDWRRRWQSSRWYLGRTSTRDERRFAILRRELGVSRSRSSRQRLLYKQLSRIDKLMLKLFLLDLRRRGWGGRRRLRWRGGL